MRHLYTYLPKGNTAKTEGILSTRLAPEGWEKYKERSGMKTKAEVLEWLDNLAPGFKRSNAISVLTEPIPEDADPAIREFADAHELYAIPEYKELARLALAKAIRRTNLGNRRGTVAIDAPHYRKLDWKNIKPGKFLFSNTPHYILETTQGKIPAEYVYDTKQRARQLLKEIADRATEEQLPIFAVTEGASVTRNNGSDAVRAARKAHESWERAHGEDPNEDWNK